MKAQRGVKVNLFPFFDLGAGGWMVKATPRLLYPRVCPGNHCIGRLVGLSAGLGENVRLRWVN